MTKDTMENLLISLLCFPQTPFYSHITFGFKRVYFSGMCQYYYVKIIAGSSDVTETVE